MDEITRAVELSKARVLELDAAILEIALEKVGDHEALVQRIREIAVMMRDQCRDLRAKVAQCEPDRN